MEHIHVEERMAVALVTYAADQKYTGLHVALELQRGNVIWHVNSPMFGTRNLVIVLPKERFIDVPIWYEYTGTSCA